jgi:uncharacterized membrane protein required for colicin V production
VDYLAAVAVLRGCYVGYRSGLFPELLRIAGYVITVAVTFRFYETLAQTLTLKTFLNLTSATAVAFITLLIVVFVVVKLLTFILLKILKVGEGGFFYRLIGLIVGACRWVILLSLIFMCIDYLPMESLKKDIHERSVVGPKVATIAPVIFDFLSHLSPQLGVPAQGTKTGP